VRIVLVRQAHAAPRADLGDGVNGISDLRIDGAEYGREGEVVCRGQLLAPTRQTRRQAGRVLVPVHSEGPRRVEARAGTRGVARGRIGADDDGLARDGGPAGRRLCRLAFGGRRVEGRGIEGAQGGGLGRRQRVRQGGRGTGHRTCAIGQVRRSSLCIEERLVGGDGRHYAVGRMGVGVGGERRRRVGAPERREDA
jgi:hypothetical protein